MNYNFKMSELLHSDIASKYNISNIPDAKSLDCLFDLITYCLQPIRNYIGKPMIITSGYRSPRLNAHPLINGKPNSQHQKGQAADFVIQGMTPDAIIQKVISSGVQYDQIINEFDRWVHISYVKGRNRMQKPFKIS